MKKLLSIVLAIFLCSTIHAQNDVKAEKSVKTTLSLLKKNAYESQLSVVYYNSQTKKNDVKRGHLLTKGNLFNLTLGGIETKYDGLTQWVYIAQNNEVTITEPGQDELAESNPIMMIEHNCKVNRINYDTEQEEKYELINFFPKTDIKSSEYFKVTLRLNRTTHLPRSFVIYMRNGDKITFNWENITKKQIDDNTPFVFNKKEYINVDINDLR